MFYDNFLLLCEEAGVSPSTLLVELSISKGNLKRWREGIDPTNPMKKKIADYFGITVKELVSGKKEVPATVNDDELSADELHFLSVLRQLPPEQRVAVEQLARSLRNNQ